MNLNTEEKRNNLRTPCNENICFIVNGDGSLNDEKGQKTINATVIDISATGMGVTTNFKLRKNLTIQFSKGQPNWELPDTGVVIWSYKYNDTYRAGIEFIISEAK